MDRTLRAALLAALIAFAAVAGFGVFLGFDPTGSVIAGLILAVLSAVLIWGAARRAETFHEPTPPSPGFPDHPTARTAGPRTRPTPPTATPPTTEATTPEQGADPPRPAPRG
jgi:hypothetical protein